MKNPILKRNGIMLIVIALSICMSTIISADTRTESQSNMVTFSENDATTVPNG